MEFGFSYIGLVYLLMLFIPNIVWSRMRPVDYDELAGKEDRFLVILERIGEISAGKAIHFFEIAGRDQFTYQYLLRILLVVLKYSGSMVAVLRFSATSSMVNVEHRVSAAFCPSLVYPMTPPDRRCADSSNG